MDAPDTSTETVPATNRLVIGGAVFICGQLAPLCIPLVVNSSLPSAWKTGLSGLLLLGLPELGLLAAVAILGKPGFEFLKRRLFALLKRLAPPSTVGRTRYLIGIALFIFCLLQAWAGPYVGHLLPMYQQNTIALSFVGDLIFLISLFVLGGEFWDKIRALFVHQATASFSASAAPTADNGSPT